MRQISVQEAAQWIYKSLTVEYRRLCLSHWRKVYGDQYVDEIEFDAAHQRRMNMPQRIQRKRTKGWKMPPNTVSVCRPSLYGNRYIIGGNPVLHTDGELHDVPDAETAVRLHREEIEYWAKQNPDIVREMLEPLRGKNLACFCKIGEPCHADTLIEVSNNEVRDAKERSS